MTKTEALKLVFTVKAAYPVYYRNVSQIELEAMADLWIAVLEDYSYEECFTAVTTYLRSGKKEILQSPGQIVDEIEKLKAAGRPEGALTPIEAWERYVRPAIRDGLYHSAESYEKMPEIVQEAIHSPDYLRELAGEPSETIDSVERSNFINRLFPTAVTRRQDTARMPAKVRLVIESSRAENEAAEGRRIASIEAREANMLEQKSEAIYGDRVHELRMEYARRKAQ